jgi:hypothetical protein
MNFLARLNEPSTQAGLAGLASAAVTLGANPTTVGHLAAGLQAVFSLLAVFMPEQAGN